MWKLTEKNPDFTYWKSVFLDIFCSVLTVLLDAPEIFSWGPGPNPTWLLRIGIGCNGVPQQKFRFFKDFCQIKQKVENGSCSRLSCVNQHDFKWMYDIPYESTHSQLWFRPKFFSKSKIHILPIVFMNK